jgi:CHAD domain-containing protein
MLHHRPFERHGAREHPALERDRSSSSMRAVPKVKPDDPVGCAVSSALRAGVSRIVSREGEARSGDGEGVHRLRVATRRLRSELCALESLVERGWRQKVEAELKWLAGLLGDVRDLDVLTARLREAIPEGQRSGGAAQPLAPLFNDFQKRRTQASRRMTDGLRSDRYRSLLTMLVDGVKIPVIEDLAGEPCRNALPPVAASAWRRLAKAARRLTPSAPVEEFHEVRKRAKRARYTAELVAPFLDHRLARGATRFIRSTALVQDLLGEHQDAVVAAAEIERGLAAHPDDPAFAHAADRLLDTQRAAAHVARTSFFKIWRKLDRKKQRRWLKNQPKATIKA